jgi:exodeoxyribonuclease-3
VRIATFNVNSVKARLQNLTAWLRQSSPDVVLLQEIKTTTEDFPALEIEDLGYNVVAVGQKSYNGVAILSKHPLEVEQRALPGDAEDAQARYVEALIGRVRVASIYLPNGNGQPGEDFERKFEYKLRWMRRLQKHARKLLAYEEILVLGGDYNLCPTDIDVYDPEGWRDDALVREEARTEYRKLVNLGFTDAFRAFHSEPHRYSFWDYQGRAFERDNGLRIDHLLLSPQAADHLVAADIDKGPREQERPSDHTPVWCELDVEP